MTLREPFPDSIAFTVELRFADERQYRVGVHLDAIDRLLIFPSGIFPDIDESDEDLENFLKQIAPIAANQWAYVKWDGSRDRFTEIQKIHIDRFYQIDYESLKFDITFDTPLPIVVDELVLDAVIQL